MKYRYEKNEKIRYMKHVEKKSEMIHLLRREENNEKEFIVHKVYDGIYKIDELQRFVFSEGQIFSVKFRENNGKIIETEFSGDTQIQERICNVIEMNYDEGSDQFSNDNALEFYT